MNVYIHMRTHIDVSTYFIFMCFTVVYIQLDCHVCLLTDGKVMNFFKRPG